MKENSSIDQLFQKAANTPVHTSFDEAKERFSTSLAQGQKIRKRRRLNTWILMITLITSALVTGFLFFGNTTSESNSDATNPHLNNTKSSKSTEDKPESLSDDKTLPTMEQLAVLNAPKTYEFTPMSTADQRRLLKEPELLKFPHLDTRSFSKNKEHFIFSFAADRREHKDSVEIPTLTEKEIAENEKAKRKMIKALAKRDKDAYAYIPSGSSKYKGQAYSVQAFYMQTKEVTNSQYRTFLNDLLIQGRTEDYKTAYPQEEQWTEKAGGQDVMYKMYFKHPAYDNYPVVNVTRKGAEMYCVWLTKETNNSKYVDEESMINDIRLPQRLEWTYAASGGNSKNVYPWGSSSTKNAENCYLANYMPDSSLYIDGAFFTASTGTYVANDFGLYNISGNAAEMVYGSTTFSSKSDLIALKKDPGTAGGGWMDDADALKIEGDDPYAGTTEGHPNIGFRVVMTYLKKK